MPEFIYLSTKCKKEASNRGLHTHYSEIVADMPGHIGVGLEMYRRYGNARFVLLKLVAVS